MRPERNPTYLFLLTFGLVFFCSLNYPLYSLEKKALSYSSGQLSNDKLSSLLDYALSCSFLIKGKNNIGTGFFISSNGFAVTCRHVVENDEGHVAVLEDHEEFPVGIISTSEKHDLAIILVTTHKKTPCLTLVDLIEMNEGDKIYTVGSFSGDRPFITGGTFTAIRSKMPADERVIQFSAFIRPGNSGGPLLNKNGKVLGIVSWKLVSNRGLPVTNAGFAVPSVYLVEEYGKYLE